MKFSNKLLSLSVLLSSVAFADDTDSTLPSGTEQELTSHQKSVLEDLNTEISKLPLENRAQAVAVAINSGETNPILQKFNDAAATVADFVVENAYFIVGGVAITFAVSGATKHFVTVPDEGFEGVQKHLYNIAVFPVNAVGNTGKFVCTSAKRAGSFVKGIFVRPEVQVEVQANDDE